MAKHKVLSTKKIEPSLIEKVKQAGIEIVEQEFIAVNPIALKEKLKEITSWIDNNDAALVFTSSNAVDAVKSYFDKISGRQFYCIGRKTKKTLLNYVVEDRIINTGDYVSELAKKIIADGLKKVVFFCGNKRRDELPEMLKQAGISVNEVVVYETLVTPHIITEDFDAVLFFSPSAVQSFFSANQLNLSTVCFAIGETTAESIAQFAKNKIMVSAKPSQEILLDAVLRYFEHSDRQL